MMATIHMSAEEYRRQFGAEAPAAKKSAKTQQSDAGDAAKKPKKPNKYRSHIVYVYEDGFISETKLDGHGAVARKYDSKKEFLRHRELMLVERAGKISELRTQVPMIIADAFTDRHGKKHRAIVYNADFVYVEDGVEVVEDVKAFDERKRKFLKTRAFDLKWKQLQAKYPDKEFRLY